MSESNQPNGGDQREFARTPVQWPAWIKPLDHEQASALDVEVEAAPLGLGATERGGACDSWPRIVGRAGSRILARAIWI